MTDAAHTLTRRSFVKAGGALGALTVAGGALASGGSLFGTAPKAFADAEEKVVWGHCNINCLSCCALKFHVENDNITYVESDTTGDPDDLSFPQARACLKGRSIRRWLQSADRLDYPMKRVGPRGSGQFERISWDEALDTVANELKRIRETYGDEAISFKHSTGVINGIASLGAEFKRLLNMTGGFLDLYGTPSFAQLTCAAEYTYGIPAQTGSSLAVLQEGQLVVLFGGSPGDSRMGGAGQTWAFMQACERLNCKVICIDYRRSDSSCNWSNWEYVAIRPGTDAALVSALAYEIIQNGWTDEEYLATYCVGYDESTLPESAKGKSASYKDYILGTGYDMTPKTPEWAAEITQIPADKIRDLAKEIATAKPVYIAQGYGSQRHSNGELTAKSILMLPNLLGQVGLPGTNDGRGPAGGGLGANPRASKPGQVFSFPVPPNPVKKTISFFTFIDAIEHPEIMTATRMGVRGGEKLESGTKMLIAYAAGGLLGQHCDLNRCHQVLSDESLCEFILAIDVVASPSTKYADIILPDLAKAEQFSIATNSGTDCQKAVIYGTPVYEPKFERRSLYDMCKGLAERFGILDEYTEGHETMEDWQTELYAKTLELNPNLPTLEEGHEMGVWKDRAAAVNPMAAFRKDPVANKLGTPSGKIEIYSETLQGFADTWELLEGQVISPIAIFDPGTESYLECNEEYPLIVTGYHHKAHVHSSYANNKIIQDAAPHRLWINPVDAAARNIEDGDEVRVYNMRGELRIKARVTDRIVPGVVTMPQGMWPQIDFNGDGIDYGGCINMLTSQRPSPIYKGAPMHTNIGQVEKVEA